MPPRRRCSKTRQRAEGLAGAWRSPRLAAGPRGGVAVPRDESRRTTSPLIYAKPLARSRILQRWRRWRSRRSLLRSPAPPPTLELPVSQAVTAAQCAEGHYARWCEVIRERPKLHRKQWEFVYVLRALESCGLLKEGKTGLGFGVGREPLVAAIAAHGPRVLATDLPPGHPMAAGWAASGEYGGSLEALNGRGICPEALFRDRVRFAFVDMREAAGLRGTYDFVWSSCALEHLGSPEAGLRFLRASLERLVPGGVALHTTEYNVSSDTKTVDRGPVVLYRRRDLLALASQLRMAGFEIELNLHTGNAPADRHVDMWPYDGTWHLKVLHTRFATTSIGLMIRRPLDSVRRP